MEGRPTLILKPAFSPLIHYPLASLRINVSKKNGTGICHGAVFICVLRNVYVLAPMRRSCSIFDCLRLRRASFAVSEGQILDRLTLSDRIKSTSMLKEKPWLSATGIFRDCS